MQIQFRSPTEKPIHLANLFAQAAVVGPEFRDLPSGLHQLAFEKGCISNNMTRESYVPDDADGREEGSEARIRDLLRAMKANPGPEDFTKSGAPNLTTLSKTLGFGVIRDDVLKVWAEVKDEETPE